ncbi:unnamed protein product, partial [Discosporangium mesarthrocarpum]
MCDTAGSIQHPLPVHLLLVLAQGRRALCEEGMMKTAAVYRTLQGNSTCPLRFKSLRRQIACGEKRKAPCCLSYGDSSHHEALMTPSLLLPGLPSGALSNSSLDLSPAQGSEPQQNCADKGMNCRNVHRALLKKPTTWGSGGEGDKGEDELLKSDVVFHSYLLRLMEEQPLLCRKDRHIVHRCLQLSLRLATKLRPLPLGHTLVDFCAQAMRGIRVQKSREQIEAELGRCQEGGAGSQPIATDVGRVVNMLGRKGKGQGDAEHGTSSEGGMGNGGKSFQVMERTRPMWRQYLGVVESAVDVWARDMEAYCLDPLWLLPKLKAHKHWSLALNMCVAVVRRWEQGAYAPTGKGSEAGGRVQPVPSSSTYIACVFDTLWEACEQAFVSRDMPLLSAALAATWSADLAVKRVARVAQGP